MSLLECICCTGHQHSVATSWDPCSGACVSHTTYSHLLETALSIASSLRHLARQYCSVGLYGECCTEMVAVIISVMAMPAPYVPLSMHQPLNQRIDFLQKNKIEMILVLESALEVRYHADLYSI